MKHLLIMATLLLTSCATINTYNGEKPNLKLTGEKRELELEKFHLADSYFSNGYKVLTMGPDRTLYTLESLKPIIEEVSPEAIKQARYASYASYTQIILLSAAFTILVTDFEVGEWSNAKETTYYSLLASSLGAGFVSMYFTKNISTHFNNDLKEKLSLGLKTTFNF